jgi:hypothetical protein
MALFVRVAKFAAKGSTERQSLMSLAGLITKDFFMDLFIGTILHGCSSSSNSLLNAPRPDREHPRLTNERKRKVKRLKNKDVTFFSPPKVSGTDIWINPDIWRD